MIRRALKRALGRALGRDRAASAPPRAKPRTTPPHTVPPEPSEEEDLPELEVDAAAVAGWVADERAPLFLDIRERYEMDSGHVEGAWLIPMNQIPDNVAMLPRDRPVVVYCAAGVRSFGVAGYLREQGVADAWSLVGGIGAWLDAGGRWLQPPPGAEIGLLRPVRVALGGDGGEAVGTVQSVTRPSPGGDGSADAGGEGPVFAVLIEDASGGGRLLDGLTRAQIQPIGRVPRR